MGFKWLKRIRVVISLAFFILISFLFIDFANTFSGTWVNRILYFQFLPSVLKFINLLSVIATGFIIITLLSFLFGRVYCSFLCPLGTLQDIFHFFAQKLRKKKRRKYYKPLNWLRFPIFIIALILLLVGNVLLLNMLDPYSVFGKITSNFLRPIYFEANNLLVFFLEKREVYTIKPVELKNTAWLSFGYAAFIFGLITWMTLKHGRLYCNSICPVGTLLGRFSELSLFKIKLDQVACTSCGICSNNCKANCIDTQNKFVDFSRCVGCLDCLYVCPGGGVKFTFSPGTVKKNQLQPIVKADRRDFVKKSVFIPVGLTALSKNLIAQEANKNKEGMIPVVRENPVTPPGSVNQEHFVNYCTACTLCVSACPTQVLQPSFLEYGLAGMMQPRMDYKTSFCNFECIVCSEVCPTGAIKPIELETKKLTQLGKAKFIKENCVVYTDETACGACSEHCPTKAVDMVPYEDKAGLTIPEVTEEICIGCGACEYACPTDPKSIYVEGNVEHVLAEKPPEEEIEKQELEEFPF
jgi:ferredoxin